MQGKRRGPTWAVVALAVWGCLSGLGLALTVLDGGATGREVTIGALVTVGALGGSWFVGGRRREPEPRRDGTVVARAAWWLRLGGLLAGAMGAGLWANVLGLVANEPDSGTVEVSGAAGAALTVGVAVVATVLLVTAWGVWWFRQTLDEREATSRVLLGTTRIAREQATAVRVVPVVVHAGHAGGRIPVARLVVEGPDQRGAAARAGFDPTMVGTDEALAMLDRWVSATPELVADEPSRELFRARGSLPTT
ncbi:hypothetical protein [Nocardioides lacusdianchii]|uniref:hypothetical protein n=1 Tax=Nocardioides lacusdianchii TaxID=2783664 RepID=UPI001CCC99D0|nr:hypothetical protein [Nocardioides lacusdianchii]